MKVRIASKEELELNKQRQQLLRSLGYNVPNDGSWGPWLDNIWKQELTKRTKLAKNKTASEYFLDNLWKNENPKKEGYKNNKWGKYNDGTGDFVGPGINYKKYATKELLDSINLGTLSNSELLSLINKVVNLHILSADKQLSKFTTKPDTVSPLIKAGFYDILWQVGPDSKWPKLSEAIATGDVKNLEKESKTIINKGTSKEKIDHRRHAIRLMDNMHYKKGGLLNLIKSFRKYGQTIYK